MQTWTFTDPRVIQAMDRVHPVRIELSAGPNQAEHFAVSAVPTLILITPTEEEVTRHEGRLTGDAFVAWLNQGLAHVEEPESENSPEPAEATPRQPTDRGSFLDSPVTLPIVPVSPLGTGDTIIDVRHRPPQFADAGQDLPIQVHVIGSADRAVFRHRTPGETVFHDVQMVKTTRDLFHCVVPGQHVTRMGVEYYITVIRDDMSVTIPAAGSGRPQRVGVR
jgi:hypothetical protein